MAKKPARKPVEKKLAKQAMKGTKGGLIGLLMPPSIVKSPGIKLGSPTPTLPLNQIPPTPCV